MGERHLSREAVGHFRLGFTGDAPEVGDPSNRISIPYWSWSGPMQIRFRALDDSKPKYLGGTGANTTLYNTLALTGIDQVVYLTEGELDCMTAWMCDLPAVGIPGSTNWKKGFWRLFRYRTVVVLADGDEAGEKLGESVRADVEDVKVKVFPPKMDVNSFFAEYGKQELRRFVGADK